MEVLDVTGGERSSKIGMQHFEPAFLHDDARLTPEVAAELELSCRRFRPRLVEELADEFRAPVVSQWV